MNHPEQPLANNAFTREEFRSAKGVLLVLREPMLPAAQLVGQPPIVPPNIAEGAEILLAVWSDGSINALNSHVDLGTGLATALAQLVAEELNAEVADVYTRLGDTSAVPNQGPTIASASIQIHASPQRQAAAQARGWLEARAAERWGVANHQVEFDHGICRIKSESTRRLSIADLIAHQHVELFLDLATPLKPVDAHRVVGTVQPRSDITAKVMGDRVFVHDMRVPGMLHGRVIRPPYAGLDAGEFVGKSLDSIDEASIAHIPGIRAVVVNGDFVGVVAEREENAERAMQQLVVCWKPWPGMPSVGDIEYALRTNTATQRRLVDEGDVDTAIRAAAESMDRTYVWPYQLHASIGPSCAVADWRETAQGSQLKVWSGTQNPHALRADLAKLMALTDLQVHVVRMEAAGCYGRNGADDVTADAALLARAVGAPVRVQLTRAQEHQWEPKGAAQLMTVRGALNTDGSPAAYSFETSYPSNAAPTLALLLTRTIEPVAQSFEMGDRTARPPYSFANLRVAVNDMPPILRASWLRGVSALPNSFAHESYIDELAVAAGVDPIEYRLRYLADPRGVELIRATAERAQWATRDGQSQSQANDSASEVVSGQGFAYARYVHSAWPGYGAAWSTWVANVDVNRRTGEVHVKRVVVGHDAGMVVNPLGVQHQVHGNVLQTTSRALNEQVTVTQTEIQNKEWGSYPILSFRDVPVIEVMQMPRQHEAPLGAGESASVPGTAAIANAIFDATGVRFRQPPFTPEVIRDGLREAGLLQADSPTSETSASENVSIFKAEATPQAPGIDNRFPSTSLIRRAGLFALGVVGVVAALVGWRATMEPIAATARSGALRNPFTKETIDRGRGLAAIGNCVGCHTAENGMPNVGGRALETTFGTIYSSNITPDDVTGIGNWSFAAFARAMREGVSRDGRHLYPAFPYTSYARVSEEDLLALYAYLMNEPAVRSARVANTLRFPYDQRALLAGWKGMFHDPQPVVVDTSQSEAWNRGAYLVQGLGHCGACHSPRNSLGAEQTRNAALSGAMIQGQYAPPLTSLSQAPVPWTQSSLYQYLREGHSLQHGVASGQMTQIVKTLSAASDTDTEAMSVYLASLMGNRDEAAAAARKDAVIKFGERSFISKYPLGEQLFKGACSSCHHAGEGPKLVGLNIPLALNTKVHGPNPDNMLRVILQGVDAPVNVQSSYMPGFSDAFDDIQLTALMRYIRERFAPEQVEWPNIDDGVMKARQAHAIRGQR